MTTSTDSHTNIGRKVYDGFFALNVSAIFVRMCIWGELWFALNVGFVKITYLVLAWLNEQLAGVHLAGVSVLVVIVGFTMFLCPVVPGIPVYVFSGIVLASQRQSIELWPSIGLATALSVATKLAACTGEYFIGYFMGKSVKIQQLICVDQVGTRAIEKILNKRGLAPSKVAILIGGPDWPTSVTCGILKINIPQMLLGTLPIAFICFPCVVAGACLTRVTGGRDDPWFEKSALAILASTICQGGAFCLAVYFVGEIVAKYPEELEAYRPEHAVVTELTRKEAAYSKVYFDVTSWQTLALPKKILITVAVFGNGFSNFVFTMLGSKCFRPFQLSSRIGDPEDAHPPGLAGKPLNILRGPGWAMLFLFFVSAFLHWAYFKISSSKARSEFAKQAASKVNGQASGDAVKINVEPVEASKRPSLTSDSVLSLSSGCTEQEIADRLARENTLNTEELKTMWYEPVVAPVPETLVPQLIPPAKLLVTF